MNALPRPADIETLRPADAPPASTRSAAGALLTDDSLALTFARAHALELRYVAFWSQWLRWDGAVWRPDSTLRVFDEVRRLLRAEAARLPPKKRALVPSLTSAARVTAIEKLARCDRRLAATVDQWDRDPWLLNTPGGVIDLRSGRMHKACPKDYLTKLTAAAPSRSVECPLWLAFLDRTFAGNRQVIEFVQRHSGYALTGNTSEHVFAFFFGSGANGKSVFVSTLAGCLADYAQAAPAETFMASKGERHPVELADLRGARLVHATEVDRNRRWNEARIKMLTGGDTVRARFMRQDPFSFVPQMKLIISGNHRPRFDSVDEATRRRILLVPFLVTIPKAERDSHLTTKLQREWPGILRWCIEGCLEWQRGGLQPPPAVTEATEDYISEQDHAAEWLAANYQPDPDGFELNANLFASWEEWARERELSIGTQLSLGDAILGHGFERHRTNTGRGFRGLRRKPEGA